MSRKKAMAMLSDITKKQGKTRKAISILNDMNKKMGFGPDPMPPPNILVDHMDSYIPKEIYDPADERKQGKNRKDKKKMFDPDRTYGILPA